MKYLSGLLCGVLFGVGLAISQMANPSKVIGFLDVTGNWDPSLLFVLGGAVAVTVIGFRVASAMVKRPVFGDTFERIPATRIDGRLILGAALFGTGWGLSGYCPGPGFVSLARLAPDAAIFVAAFFVGSWVYRALKVEGTGATARASDIAL